MPVLGIAGSSAGAVVGALWLLYGNAAAARARWAELLDSGLIPPLPEVRLGGDVSSRDNVLLQFARRLKRSAFLALALERRCLISHEGFDRALEFLVGGASLESLHPPLAVVAADFETGAAVVLRRGSLRKTLAASCAIPGVLLPYVVDGRALVDGGIVADVPVEQARTLVEGPVVAVEVAEAPGPDDPDNITVPRALMRAGLLTQQALRERVTSGADLVIRPDVAAIHWSDLMHSDEAFEAGRAEATVHLPEIRALASGAAGGARSQALPSAARE